MSVRVEGLVLRAFRVKELRVGGCGKPQKEKYEKMEKNIINGGKLKNKRRKRWGCFLLFCLGRNVAFH